MSNTELTILISIIGLLLTAIIALNNFFGLKDRMKSRRSKNLKGKTISPNTNIKAPVDETIQIQPIVSRKYILKPPIVKSEKRYKECQNCGAHIDITEGNVNMCPTCGKHP